MRIVKGRSIPEKPYNFSCKWKTLGAKMETGDCVEGLTESESDYLYQAMRGMNRKTTRRKIGNFYSVWRI
jgi:hypothetical protein